MDILIIRFSSLGDVVMTSAVVEALAREIPGARLFFLTKREYEQVFEGDERLFKVIGVDKGRSPFHIIRLLGGTDFDCIIDLHNSFRSAVVRTFLKAPIKTVVDKHSLKRRIMVLSRNRYSRSFNVLQNYLDTLKPLGITTRTIPRLIPDRRLSALVDALLRVPHDGQKKPMIGIFPGTRHILKRWHEESFAKLADMITSHGMLPVFMGDVADTAVVESIRGMMDGDSLSLAGDLDLKTTIAVTARLKALLTNDSAPMHIAGALGVPFAAVFGPTHPNLGFCPGYPKGAFLHSGVHCSPCSLHGGSRCRKKTQLCMDAVTPSMVWDALNKVIDI